LQIPKLYFDFPDIRGVNEFAFEKLSHDNFQQLFLLFENDESPFTEESFKHYDSAEKYVNDLEKYGRVSPKHGSQDWLFKYGDEYAGILHLYDLSLETFAENNKRCWIGFAIKPSLRNKGIMKKAVTHIIHYIFQNYPLIKYIHGMSLKDNLPAEKLFYSTGFQKDEEERLSKNHNFYLFEKTK
jgi:RimJ/RimL family protein N-acetyltransferase